MEELIPSGILVTGSVGVRISRWRELSTDRYD